MLSLMGIGIVGLLHTKHGKGGIIRDAFLLLLSVVSFGLIDFLFLILEWKDAMQILAALNAVCISGLSLIGFASVCEQQKHKSKKGKDEKEKQES